MYTSKKLFVLSVILFFSHVLSAQYYSSGADPSGIKWNKIETENFKVVFPDSFNAKGQYLAKVLEEVYKYGGMSLKHKPRKISVLVHSETAYSNGFVSWAPKRMELYSNPNQDIYAQDWLQQLALHEFRHVVQLDKLNTGLTKMLSYILGEQAVGAVLGLYVPMWFLEGDAVVAETALTASGRGRSPDFEQGLRAQVLDKEIYSYEKAMFGSYRDYVPNHYEMGYQLVAGARAKYGSDIWEKALNNTGRNPLSVTPFNRGQKKMSGLNKSRLYKDVFSELKKDWEQQDAVQAKNIFTVLTKPCKEYVSYEYPVAIGQMGYLAEMSGPGQVNKFVHVEDDGDCNTLFVPGNRNKEPFSFANKTLCWAELEPDLRWENRMYSVIKCYHIPTKRVRKITHKSRYFAPALSPRCDAIAAISVDNQNNYRLVVLDAKTGELRKAFEYGDNKYLFTPSWNGDGTKLVCVALGDGGKEIAVLDMATEEWQQITKPSFVDVSLPKWGDDEEIFFTAAYSGTDEIYRIHKGVRTQLTQSKYGAKGVDSYHGQLVYSNYTADGYQLACVQNKDVLNIPLAEVVDQSVKLHEQISDQELRKPDFSAVDTVANYPIEKYSKWNLFHLHSWAPAFVRIDDQEFRPGLSLMSQNLLGTTSATMGYNADSQESLEKYYLNFKYQAWYPVFELELKHGDDRIKYDPSIIYASSVDTFSYGANQKIRQTQIKLDVSIPFNLSRGKYHVFMQPALNYGTLQRSGYSVELTKYTMDGEALVVDEKSAIDVPDVNYQTLEYSLYFHRLLRRSQYDVAPRWGQVAEILYQNTPWGNMNAGSILGVHTRLYLPGLMKHHAVKLEGNYQYKTMGDRLQNSGGVYRKHGDYFNLARGYESYSNDRLLCVKGDYIFPLLNPDLNLPGLFYLKRVTTHLFYDYSQTQESLSEAVNLVRDFSSTGVEMRAEVHAFRFMFPLNVGYRYARLLKWGQNKHEFLLGINISGFSIGR